MKVHVVLAIFKRNFISYFSNPTGYVFICVFVLLCSFAAFWPTEFFNANLVNLDQLNKYLPFILLVFIPAITMSMWAEERRQGTDELLLTIPAGDFDVVLGKYLAAVAIYSVALVFSMLCNLVVLKTLGDPDFGLLTANYVGYWIVGLAMLAVGMVASFLTGNLTVSFVLGAAFNAPLVFLVFADALPLPFLQGDRSAEVVARIRSLSISEQFRDFAGGVIGLASVVYFLAIVAIMLYASIVLIGRRHWRGGPEGRSVALHYLVRFLALLVAAVGITTFLSRHDVRADASADRLNSLSPETRQLVAKLDETATRPVRVDAFVSTSVPESYVQTRLNLLNTLRELERINPDRLIVHEHPADPYSAEATRAEKQFGIKPVRVVGQTRGVYKEEEIILGVAITSGLEKVVVPFIDRGVPVEYELVRSIAVVSKQERKKIGVINTDAKLFGGFNMQNFSQTPAEQIVQELRKQYEVEQVDLTSPLSAKFDALLAVQPSSLGPQQLENFIAAVKTGVPTAIFEDPLPILNLEVPGTAAPKQAAGGGNPMFGGRQPPQPKGNIQKLWQTLGVEFTENQVISQDFNPYPKVDMFTPEWVFVDQSAGAENGLNQEDRITSKLRQVLLPFPGAIKETLASPLKVTPLLTTNRITSVAPADKLVERNPFGGVQVPSRLQIDRLRKTSGARYVVAARIQGKLKAENVPMSDKPADLPPGHPAIDQPPDAPAEDEPAKPAAPAEINVVLVSDIDCLFSVFFNLRARGQGADPNEVDFHFENVIFVLNLLDDLAGDQRFIELRKRRPEHRTLTVVEGVTQKSKEDQNKQKEQIQEEFTKSVADENQKLTKVRELVRKGELSPEDGEIRVREATARLQAKETQLKQKVDEEYKQIERDLASEIRAVQDGYKRWAVLLPPIPPLLLAAWVFFDRRRREREGVSKSRLK